MGLEWWANVVFLVVALGIGGLVVWDRVQPVAAPSAPRARAEIPPPAEPVSIAGAPAQGEAKAPVVLIEWSDFECPFCGKSATELLPGVERLYVKTGKVRLVFKQRPLAMHANALGAAEAAECAGRQGQFWAFHDWAFRNQRQLGEQHLQVQAKEMGLDSKAFAACVRDGEAAARVKADIDQAERYQITGTPTWFVGLAQADETVKVTERFSGAKPLAEVRQALDRAFATATNVSPR